jgi:oligopeptide/dipeptide ABC transporter ATP-binding protein
MNALLEAVNVSKVFGTGRDKLVALDDFSLAVLPDRPTITAIAGESGSGKTTLARLLLGIILPSAGEMRYRGQRLGKMSGQAWRTFRREVQAIFQDPFEVYNPFYRVDRVLETPIAKFGLAHSRADARNLIDGALRAAGLRPEETLGRFPDQLSGGQRQRIMIARALVLQPKIIIADEPVSMVDASSRASILENLLKLQRDQQITVLYITHDLTTAYQLCENIVVLYRGRVAEAGSVEQVIKDPQHPYTQLLVSSIPRPEPGGRWGGPDAPIIGDEASARRSQGCLYAGRCPVVMDRCWEQRPAVYQVNGQQGAACWRHDGRPTIEPRQLLAARSLS